MRVAIMQPYFFPYIGYFQLIKSADIFVIYDNIKYTKKGWINRNRILQNGVDTLISLPIKNGSDSLHVYEREVSADFDKKKFLNRIKGAYARAPHFSSTYALLEQIISYNDVNLFDFLNNSVTKLCAYLEIDTKIVKSSSIKIDHNLRSQDKVLALCSAVGAKIYINAIGGMELYSKEVFTSNNIELKFIKSNSINYKQFDHEFCPWLSIIDVMMFNDMEFIKASLINYELIEGI